MHRTRSGSRGSCSPPNTAMGGAQKRVLKAWPGASGPLLSFERPHQSIEHLINREFRLSQGSLWICRVQSDGLAHEVTGRIVRPGQRYVVLSEAPLPSQNGMLAAAQVDCTGVCAGLLTIPGGVSTEDQNFLQGLRLQVARTVRIWPAGMAARGWDGEGRSEWLTTETPCFGIVHDHPVDAYSLRLDNGAEQIIAAGAVRHALRTLARLVDRADAICSRQTNLDCRQMLLVGCHLLRDGRRSLRCLGSEASLLRVQRVRLRPHV